MSRNSSGSVVIHPIAWPGAALLLSAYAFIGALNLSSEHEVWIWIGLVLLFTAIGLSIAARQRVVPPPLDEPSSLPNPGS